MAVFCSKRPLHMQFRAPPCWQEQIYVS